MYGCTCPLWHGSKKPGENLGAVAKLSSKKDPNDPDEGFLSTPGRNMQKPSTLYVQVQIPIVQLHQAKDKLIKCFFNCFLYNKYKLLFML